MSQSSLGTAPGSNPPTATLACRRTRRRPGVTTQLAWIRSANRVGWSARRGASRAPSYPRRARSQASRPSSGKGSLSPSMHRARPCAPTRSGRPSRAPINVCRRSGSQTSSWSRKMTNSERSSVASNPRLRAAATPPARWSAITRTRGSSAATERPSSTVPSVEPSSNSTSSHSVIVWARTPAIVSPRWRVELYVGTITDTRGAEADTDTSGTHRLGHRWGSPPRSSRAGGAGDGGRTVYRAARRPRRNWTARGPRGAGGHRRGNLGGLSEHALRSSRQPSPWRWS